MDQLNEHHAHVFGILPSIALVWPRNDIDNANDASLGKEELSPEICNTPRRFNGWDIVVSK
jgi:hypothetical protein